MKEVDEVSKTIGAPGSSPVDIFPLRSSLVNINIISITIMLCSSFHTGMVSRTEFSTSVCRRKSSGHGGLSRNYFASEKGKSKSLFPSED